MSEQLLQTLRSLRREAGDGFDECTATMCASSCDKCILVFWVVQLCSQTFSLLSPDREKRCMMITLEDCYARSTGPTLGVHWDSAAALSLDYDTSCIVCT
eukprot:5451529-Pleurochrysis_carterae.AAC.1